MYKKIVPVIGIAGLAFCFVIETEKAASTAQPVTQTTQLNYYSDTLFVNMHNAMMDSLQGKQAEQVVRAEEKKYAELAKKEQQRMVTVKTDLETKGSMLSMDERRKLEKEFSSLQRDYQDNLQDWQTQFQTTVQRETEIMVKDIERAAKLLAENANKAVVIDAQSGRVLYVREDRDSTNDLVALLDNQYTMKLAQADKTKQAPVVASNSKSEVAKVTKA